MSFMERFGMAATSKCLADLIGVEFGGDGIGSARYAEVTGPNISY